ncbi:hypothetical protein [Aporhodopirellula aestuarii]|uniref:Ankyrin repeat domain-containing protein n=1 Tax=Aporhodopirellula aestuarii TaxID=2950107 RepID=A0ABT0UD02_9BACT|nr:hypothetical protein [Aporhodopirellula aestuarii]MCM2374661.1 hypothetical protein [Aporhodopirellula aestuarii]
MQPSQYIVEFESATKAVRQHPQLILSYGTDLLSDLLEGACGDQVPLTQLCDECTELVQLGVSPNPEPQSRRDPPLSIAAELILFGDDYRRVSETLLTLGADPNLRVGDCSLLLFAAVTAEVSQQALELLIELGATTTKQDQETLNWLVEHNPLARKRYLVIAKRLGLSI